MSIVIAVRHGRSTSNAAGTLAGRSPGVELDAVGVEQARAIGRRLVGVDLAAVVSSPLPRCRQTITLALESAGLIREVVIDERVVETDYGRWSGRPLAELRDEPLWHMVHHHPEVARFPGGESMVEVRDRIVAAVLDWNSRLAGGDVWMLASHGDALAALVNWAVGADFAHVQRLGLDPASASIIALPAPDAQTHTIATPPRVLAVNTLEGALSRWCTSPTHPVVGGATDQGCTQDPTPTPPPGH